MKRWLVSLALAATMMGALFYYLIQHHHFQWSSLKAIPPGYLFLGLSLALADLGLRGLRLKWVTHQVGQPIAWFKAVRVCLAVDFFAAITPARLGGEPARMVGVIRAGLNVSKTLIVLGIEALMDFGYLLLALPFFLWLSAGYDSNLVQWIRSLITGGLLLIGIPVALMLMRPAYIGKLFSFFSRRLPLLYRLISGMGRWQPESKVIALRAQVVEALRGPWWYFPMGVLFTCSWWALRFGSLLWIAQALNYSLTLGQVFWPQFLIYNSIIFTPVPVSGGLFETSFLLLYKNFIPAVALPTTMVVWRLFTYYLFIGLGTINTSRSMWKLTLRKLEPSHLANRTKDVPAGGSHSQELT